MQKSAEMYTAHLPCHYTGAGLQLLQHLEEVKIHQKSQSGGNKYMVNTVEGEALFTMKEKNGIAAILSDGSLRGFYMEVVDNKGELVFMIRRPTVLASDKVEVYMGEQVVCRVRAKRSFMKPLFSVNDENDHPLLKIKGNFYGYKFQTLDKATIGYISKKFRGVMKEMFTYADDYEIKFPADLDVRYKAATIAACILIDYKYHESSSIV